MSEEELDASLSVENVVASTSIDTELDLSEVAFDLDGVEYDPDRFPGLVYETTSTDAVALIFRSGNIVVTGAGSVAAARESVGVVTGRFRELGIETPEDPPVLVQNIVSSGDLGTNLNLNAVAIGLGLEAVEYEPEQFPGLVYRLAEPEVVLLLFASGKVVITGGEETGEASRALAAVNEELDSLELLG